MDRWAVVVCGSFSVRVERSGFIDEGAVQRFDVRADVTTVWRNHNGFYSTQKTATNGSCER